MLLLLAAHGADGTHLHRVQHRGDGTYVILAQQQPQQPGEMLRLPVGLPQHIVELLQRGHENFPKLIQNLGAAVVPGIIQFLGHLGQPLLQLNLFQKTVKCRNLFA